MKWLIPIFLIYLSSYGNAEIDLSNIEIPDIDDISAVRERCDTKGGNGTYNKVKIAKDNLQNCLQGLIDFNALSTEVEEAKKTGSMDEVFGKYCRKRSIATNCVHNFTETIKLCLEDTEKEALNTTLDVLKQLGEFACHGDGDRIALFVAEGGVECIKGHADGIKDCVNKTLKLETTPSDTSAFPNLLFDKKKCDDLSKLQTCVVEELEKCKDSTPANIVDALLRFIKRFACNTKPKRSLRKLMKRSASVFSTTFNPPGMKTRIMTVFEKKCHQNAPEGGYEAFHQALDKMIECLKESTNQQTPLNVPVDQLKSGLQNCSSDLIKKAENCLSNSEKYFPQFYFDITYSVIDFIHANRAQLISGKFSTETMNCFQNFQGTEAKASLMSCASFEAEQIYSREETCERITLTNSCVSKELAKRCIKDAEITKLKDEFFAAVTAPCNKRKHEIN